MDGPTITLTGYVLPAGSPMPTECPQCWRFLQGMEPDTREGVPAHAALHATQDGRCGAINNKADADTTCTCPYVPRGA